MNLADMTIGIVGGGVVGHATARSLVEYVRDVKVYDVVASRGTTPDLAALIATSDLVFVCLPTPADPDGSCDTSAVERFFQTRAWRGETDANYVLKSTVPVGYTKWLASQFRLTNLVHSPEFLTARCAVTDAQLPARNVIGDTEPWEATTRCADLLTAFYASRWPHVPVHRMVSEESEALKLIQNSFFAAKVAFFNEARGLCDKLGLDWDAVRTALLQDGRINPSHTQVPGPDGSFGYGGKCLPKDIANFAHCLEAAGAPSVVARAVIARNKIDRGEA